MRLATRFFVSLATRFMFPWRLNHDLLGQFFDEVSHAFFVLSTQIFKGDLLAAGQELLRLGIHQTVRQLSKTTTNK